MIIDSDEEGSTSKPIQTFKDTSTFEELEDEYDPSEPYLPIVQHLDLPLGTEVIHISFPHLPSESSRLMSASIPPILTQKIMIAAACSDHSIRLITLPLRPPSPASKAHHDLKDKINISGNKMGPHGEHIVVLSSSAAHQTVPNSISVTYTNRDAGNIYEEETDIEDDDDDDRRSRSRSRRRSPSKGRPGPQRTSTGTEWDILLASHSSEISGILLVYRIAIIKSNSGTGANDMLSADHVMPAQQQYLPSPAIQIVFNASTYPSPRHSHLLVTGSEGSVKIYDCFPFTNSRRDHQGSWLISLFSPYDNYSTGVPARKRIVDAAWVLGGKAIISLLADGEWGIWDPQGCGPGANEISKHRSANPSGRTGFGLSNFALNGWLGSTTNSSSKTSSDKAATKSKLAPMTPGTRRVREEVLFSGPHTGGTYHLRGGIAVTRLEEPHRDKVGTDCVTLWHGSKILTIPDLASYWEGRVGGKGNLFGGDQQRSIKIDDVNLGGEPANTLDQLPLKTQASGQHRDLVIAAEHRLIFLTKPLQEPKAANAVPEEVHEAIDADQQLLVRGELDVSGMERILAGMANGSRPMGDHGNGGAARRKVGFKT